jgi:hypothetical protein
VRFDTSDVEAKGPAPGAPALRPGFVWALALVAVPMLLLFGLGFLTEIEGPWRGVMAPAYLIGAVVAPAILGLRTVRAGGSRARGAAGGLALGSSVLLVDLLVLADGGGGARGSALMAATAGGAVAVALLWGTRDAVPNRREAAVGHGSPPAPGSPSVMPAPPPPPLPPPPGFAQPFAFPVPVPDARKPNSKKRGLLLLAAVSFTLVAVGVASILIPGRGGRMPDSIDGVPRITSDRARAESDGVETAMEAYGGKAEMEAYGFGSYPSFVVVIYEEPVEATFDQEFRSFSYSFMGSSGVDLDPASAVDETLDGIRYRCESDAEGSISICVMGEGLRFTGLAVVDYGAEPAFELAKKVQAATADVPL